MFSNLRSFIEQLKQDRDLVVVDAPVDARFEVAEIHRRVIAAGGPALLFTNVRGAAFPLVTNLFGTTRRAELAFGTNPLKLVRRVVETVETILPPSLPKIWAARDIALQGRKLGVKTVRKGPVAEVVRNDFDLGSLPALTCWPEDGGPFFTLPLVYTEHPDGKGPNLGMYRMQVYDQQTTGMHWQIGKGGGFHYAVSEKRGAKLPVTVFLGGPPALILAAIAPLPENVPEVVLASLIAGEKLKVLRDISAHPLIAQAEFAFTGSVPPRVRRPEGPFGDHYGYYSLTHDFPVFQIERVFHRRDAIFPATVVGKPRQEDFYIGDLLQELLSPLFPLVMPSVEQLWSYGETGYHSLAGAVVKQRYRREAMASAFRILGEGQLSLTKFLLVTDRPVDLKDFRATLQHILERTHVETDLYLFSNLSMDTLDYTGPRLNEGSKGVWLGLGEPVRELPREFQASEPLPAGVSEVEVFCPGCLVLGGTACKDDPGAIERVLKSPSFANWPLLVLTEEPKRVSASPMNFLWATFTRFDPAADIHSGSAELVRNHVSFRPPVLIDARMKPGYPDELFCSDETSKQVSQRWNEYFPDGMEMGDSDKANLD